jgi:hypothetical protein
MCQSFFYGLSSPFFILYLNFSFCLYCLRMNDQFFSGFVVVVIPVQDHVFAELPQRWF